MFSTFFLLVSELWEGRLLRSLSDTSSLMLLLIFLYISAVRLASDVQKKDSAGLHRAAQEQNSPHFTIACLLPKTISVSVKSQYVFINSPSDLFC